MVIGHHGRVDMKKGFTGTFLTADNSFQKVMGMLSDLIEIVNHEVVCLLFLKAARSQWPKSSVCPQLP